MLGVPSFVRGVSVLAIVAGFAAPALAQDYGLGGGFKDGAPPLWRGFYLGLNAGGIVDGKASYNFLPTAADSTNTADLKGPLGGVQAGYNVQRGPVVAGLEFDADFLKTDSPAYSVYGYGNLSTQVNEAYSLRGRLGVTLTPRVLFFGTGGYALASVDHSFDPGGTVFKDSGTVGGWVAGGGLEYMHSSRLSFGVEVLHYDFGQDHFNLSFNSNGTVNTVPTEIGTEMTTLRGRISFHID
jgi:outer membrane immunogenic protein